MAAMNVSFDQPLIRIDSHADRRGSTALRTGHPGTIGTRSLTGIAVRAGIRSADDVLVERFGIEECGERRRWANAHVEA